MRMTQGSLFDGIGGFPLAASRQGVTPVWLSEIEPFPMLVTSKRFPKAKHLGDVSRINGADIEPVDILTFGSPCQDLSVAGKQAGISGGRSGLFFQAVRIIREMLRATGGKYPRAFIFENVPGLLSSGVKGKGKDRDYVGGDFAVVLKELQDLGFLLDPNIFDAQHMGVPQRRHRVYIAGININEIEGWPEYDAGQANANGDGQISFFGDCDDLCGDIVQLQACKDAVERYLGSLGRQAAEKVHAERQGVHGDYQPSGETRERTSGAADGGAAGADREVERGGVVWPDVSGSLVARADGSPCIDRGQPFVAVAGFNGHKSITGSIQYAEGAAPTLESNMPSNVMCGVFMAGQGAKAGGVAYSEDTAPTLKSVNSGGNTVPTVCVFENHAQDSRITGPLDVFPTVSRKWGTGGNNTALAVDCRNDAVNVELSATPQAKSDGGTSLNYVDPVCYGYQSFGEYKERDTAKMLLSCNDITTDDVIFNTQDWIVRRLTPLECLRLQGYPDNWVDGLPEKNPTDADIEYWSGVFEKYRLIANPVNKKGKPTKPKTHRQIAKWLKNPSSDSAAYKAAGNSVAVPCVEFVMERVVLVLGRMAALDGGTTG